MRQETGRTVSHHFKFTQTLTARLYSLIVRLDSVVSLLDPGRDECTGRVP